MWVDDLNPGKTRKLRGEVCKVYMTNYLLNAKNPRLCPSSDIMCQKVIHLCRLGYRLKLHRGKSFA